jgi:hypothetical protein
MSADQYLLTILRRETVDTGPNSPVRGAQAVLTPIIREWAGSQLLAFHPSGSFMKGTANSSGTDIDLFISLSETTTHTLKEIYELLFNTMRTAGYTPRRQNVSINVKVNGYSVDLVPAKRQNATTSDHSLYRRRADTWTKTNVATHINYIRQGGRQNETRILKLWRDQKQLDLPSFYLELVTLAALGNAPGTLASNVWRVFQYLSDRFADARFVDPANTNNIVSDDVTAAEKAKIHSAAAGALRAPDWNQIVL